MGIGEFDEPGALEKNGLEDRHVVAGVHEIGDRLDRPGHLIDREGEARQQDGRQQRDQQGDLAGAELAANRHRDEIADAEHDDEKQRRGEEQGRQRAAERHLEPEHGERQAKRRVEQADGEVRQDLSNHQLDARHRRGNQHLHGAAFPLARYRQRRELGADQRQHHRDDAGDDEVAAVQIFVEPHPGLQRDGFVLRNRPLPLRRHDLDVAGKAVDDLLRIAEPDIGGIVVRRVEDDLHGSRSEVGEALGKVGGNHHPHLAAPVIQRVRQRAVRAARPRRRGNRSTPESASARLRYARSPPGRTRTPGCA